MISFQLAFGTFFLTILGLRRTAQQRGRSATVRSITTPLSSRTGQTPSSVAACPASRERRTGHGCLSLA
jgi:hypothetical protein